NDSSTLSGCRGCHGRAAFAAFTSVAGEPNYANGGTNNIRSNSHDKHMGGSGNKSCVYCHGETSLTDGSLANTGKHADGIVTVVAGGGKSFTTTGSSFYPGTVKTCSAISCHGTGAAPATWGQSMPAECYGCHGGNALAPAPATNIISTMKHTKHMNNSARIGSNLACGECHATTVAVGNDRSIINAALHGNGLNSYSGAR